MPRNVFVVDTRQVEQVVQFDDCKLWVERVDHMADGSFKVTVSNFICGRVGILEEQIVIKRADQFEQIADLYYEQRMNGHRTAERAAIKSGRAVRGCYL